MVGTTISQYHILEKLGEGGMGVVYKAQDIRLNRTVALKFLPEDLTNDAPALERFVNEAQTASALDHANICTIYDIGEMDDGKRFIAMAFYGGETLHQKLSTGALTVDDAVDIAIQIGKGLARAHEAGITHRDIKPENIIITEHGEAKIIDFGLAKLKGQNRMTKSGFMVGTLFYMSPEQVRGEEVDQRADIWALGVTFYEMLTGQLPFAGEYDHATMYMIMNETPKALNDINPDLSTELQEIIDQTFQKEAPSRYQSVEEMISDLSRFGGRAEYVPRESIAKRSQKSGYLLGYDNDIYVSYAHVDDKSLSEGQKGWISKFHQALEIRLEQLLGSDTKIWRDPPRERSSSTGDPGKALFTNAAIMLSVVSPQYVKSEQCTDEVKVFSQSAIEREGLWVGNKARIFKAVKTYVPRDSQQKELQGLPDYEFYQFDRQSGRPQEFWPELGAEANRNFWVKLEDIAYDIYQLMEDIKSKKSGEAQVPGDPIRPAIYLSETTYDLSSYRDRIKRQLQQRGYQILPDRALPLNAADLEKQILADLDHCSHSIHLIGENYGVVPEGETRSISELQHQIAAGHKPDSGISRLIWLPANLNIADNRQQNFIESLKKDAASQIGADLLQTSLDEFKTFLIDKITTSQSSEPSDSAGYGNITRIYLQCNQKDLDDTAPLEEYLFDQGFEIKLPAFEGDEMAVFEVHKENLLLCDATLIYYGHATDSWLSTKLADLQKVVGYGRKTPMKAKAVYLGSPETKQKQRFRTREALTIKQFGDFAPETLASFIEALKNT